MNKSQSKELDKLFEFDYINGNHVSKEDVQKFIDKLIPKEIISVIVTESGIIESSKSFTDAQQAENYFLQTLEDRASNFDEYTQEDIDCILDQGYEDINNTTISLVCSSLV